MTDAATHPRADDETDPILAAAPHRVGAVALVVHDLAAVSRFYEEVIGLAVLRRDVGIVALGVGATTLLELRADPAARRWSPREAGLFHTAFLLPTRGDLGAWLRHMAERRFPIAGASDHIVSEAVYLTDPEGNGIEVYADRPSAGWLQADGSVVMSTDHLDLDALMAAATRRWTGMPAGGCVGHVHLQAGDLSRAGAFYVDLLGFGISARYPGALFYGSGGYHHQLATNLWNSRGAPPRRDATTGLEAIELILENADALAAMRARFERAGSPFVETATGGLVHDPWNTAVRLVVGG